MIIINNKHIDPDRLYLFLNIFINLSCNVVVQINFHQFLGFTFMALNQIQQEDNLER